MDPMGKSDAEFRCENQDLVIRCPTFLASTGTGDAGIDPGILRIGWFFVGDLPVFFSGITMVNPP